MNAFIKPTASPTAIRVLLVVLLASCLMAATARAQDTVLVLTHGFMSGDDTWESSGILPALHKANWHSGGRFIALPQGIRNLSQPLEEARRIVYVADLPSEAPLRIQSQAMYRILEWLRTKRHPNASLILVGHSSGGVISRLTMVEHPALQIRALITIASPHLGSDKAEAAQLLGQTPMAMFAPFMGASTLNRSQALFADLVRARPGTFLYQLNQRPHPEAHYISLVRQSDLPWGGDQIVPSWSQDMTHIPALKDHANVRTINVGDSHNLGAADGPALIAVLDTLL
jgi:pimeloyl-ACP methyl ester carboxylesterase